MINRILIELYDDYEKNNIESLIDFAIKTFPKDLLILAFYVERINTNKKVSKYLKTVVNDSNLDCYADLVLNYLDQFKPKFIEDLEKYNKKIEEYIVFKDHK